MKLRNFFTLFMACFFALTFVSCDNEEEVTPDFADAFVGTYSDAFENATVSVTKTGDNELTLSNATGTLLASDIVVTLSDEQVIEEDLFGVLTKIINYTESNSDVEFSAAEATAFGQTTATYSLIVSGDSGDFNGTK